MYVLTFAHLAQFILATEFRSQKSSYQTSNISFPLFFVVKIAFKKVLSSGCRIFGFVRRVFCFQIHTQVDRNRIVFWVYHTFKKRFLIYALLWNHCHWACVQHLICHSNTHTNTQIGLPCTELQKCSQSFLGAYQRPDFFARTVASLLFCLFMFLNEYPTTFTDDCCCELIHTLIWRPLLLLFLSPGFPA